MKNALITLGVTVAGATAGYFGTKKLIARQRSKNAVAVEYMRSELAKVAPKE